MLAEVCLLPWFDESLLLRKLSLRFDTSAAIYDPKQTLMINVDSHQYVRLELMILFLHVPTSLIVALRMGALFGEI